MKAIELINKNKRCLHPQECAFFNYQNQMISKEFKKYLNIFVKTNLVKIKYNIQCRNILLISNLQEFLKNIVMEIMDLITMHHNQANFNYI